LHLVDFGIQAVGDGLGQIGRAEHTEPADRVKTVTLLAHGRNARSARHTDVATDSDAFDLFGLDHGHRRARVRPGHLQHARDEVVDDLRRGLVGNVRDLQSGLLFEPFHRQLTR
jgi:hypothetical protein